MPCYTNQIATVEFGKNTDAALMRKAFEQLGFLLAGSEQLTGWDSNGASILFNTLTGTLTVSETFDVAALKRAYSEQIVMSTAKRNGWQLQWSTNKAGNRTAQVLRGSR